MAQTITRSPSAAQIAGMRSVIVQAIDLFAKERAKCVVKCFSVKDADWQLSLSDHVILLDCPTLKNCSDDDVIFFFRMAEIKSNDPRVFLAAIMGTPSPSSNSLHYVFRFWDAMPPAWRGSDAANAASVDEDVLILSRFLTDCLDLAAANQNPALSESQMELISEELSNALDAQGDENN